LPITDGRLTRGSWQPVGLEPSHKNGSTVGSSRHIALSMKGPGASIYTGSSTLRHICATRRVCAWSLIVRLRQPLDQGHDILTPQTPVAGEAEQLDSLCDDDAMRGLADDGDDTTPPELEHPFISEHPQGP
jgi:hypothetical protein